MSVNKWSRTSAARVQKWRPYREVTKVKAVPTMRVQKWRLYNEDTEVPM